MGRISTALISDRATNSILAQQEQLSRLQQQVSTGQRIVTASDDPIGAARVILLDQQLLVTEQFQRNGNGAEASLELEESVLQGVTNIIHRVRELTVQGANDSNNALDRTAISVELQNLLEEAQGLANTRQANGEFLFAGFQGNVQPVTFNPVTGFQYNGDTGQRFLEISPGVTVATSDSGQGTFFDILQGNQVFTTAANTANTGIGIINQGSLVDGTAYVPDDYTIAFATRTDGELGYTVTDGAGTQIVPPVTAPPTEPVLFAEGDAIRFNGVEVVITGEPAVGDEFLVQPTTNQDLFTSIRNVITALTGPQETDGERALLRDVVNSELLNLSNALDNVLQVRGEVGARLNTITLERDVNTGIDILTRELRAEIQEVDPVEAISDLASRQGALEAAFRSFATIQNLNLFNFL